MPLGDRIGQRPTARRHRLAALRVDVPFLGRLDRQRCIVFAQRPDVAVQRLIAQAQPAEGLEGHEDLGELAAGDADQVGIVGARVHLGLALLVRAQPDEQAVVHVLQCDAGFLLPVRLHAVRDHDGGAPLDADVVGVLHAGQRGGGFSKPHRVAVDAAEEPAAPADLGVLVGVRRHAIGRHAQLPARQRDRRRVGRLRETQDGGVVRLRVHAFRDRLRRAAVHAELFVRLHRHPAQRGQRLPGLQAVELGPLHGDRSLLDVVGQPLQQLVLVVAPVPAAVPALVVADDGLLAVVVDVEPLAVGATQEVGLLFQRHERARQVVGHLAHVDARHAAAGLFHHRQQLAAGGVIRGGFGLPAQFQQHVGQVADEVVIGLAHPRAIGGHAPLRAGNRIEVGAERLCGLLAGDPLATGRVLGSLEPLIGAAGVGHGLFDLAAPDGIESALAGVVDAQHARRVSRLGPDGRRERTSIGRVALHRRRQHRVVLQMVHRLAGPAGGLAHVGHGQRRHRRPPEARALHIGLQPGHAAGQAQQPGRHVAGLRHAAHVLDVGGHLAPREPGRQRL